MNFHISPFSPLRPHFSSPATLATPRPGSSGRRHHHDLADHDSAWASLGPNGSAPVRIAVQGPRADDMKTDPPCRDSHRSHNSDLDLDFDLDDNDDNDDDHSATDDSLSDASVDNIAQDSRDVLVQRLNDLADKLSAADVRATSIEALHRQVDNMERIVRGASRSRSASRHSASTRRGSTSLRSASPHRPHSLYLPPSGTGGVAESPRGRVMTHMSPISPSWLMSRFQQGHHQTKSQKQSMAEEQENHEQDNDGQIPGRHVSASSALVNPKLHASDVPQLTAPALPRRPESVDASTSTTPPDLASDVAETVVLEAEKLCTEMATVIESLRARREESDHIHTILIEREKLAHQRLQQAATLAATQQHQKQVAQIVAHHETELRHLRVQLRAIEVNCMGYVPADAHADLDRSIRSWKDNWYRRRELCTGAEGHSESGDDDDEESDYTSSGDGFGSPHSSLAARMDRYRSTVNVPSIILTSP
ncbi:hypothetical protein BD289DRAFT_430659 [Coniella lustricola]|uniref:Uncharacterized protein n=1 Tax=Coniella lustricola TaxID=2025994 RepID=A0A2T3ABM0_9PEZI|nr:hypothetical protein BD289DRAFT_430659 [Coniella lustricola]